MGRPLFTEPFVAAVHSLELREEPSAGLVSEEAGPRRWCEKDAYPDEDSWWSGKEVFIEAFLEPATSDVRSEAGDSTTAQSLEDSLKEHLEAYEKENIPTEMMRDLQRPESIQEDMQTDDVSTMFPPRYTITEEELANIQLDVRMEEDEEDDFELAWDPDTDDYNMEFDTETEPHSDVSTPAPSTPVISTRSLPLPVPTPRRQSTVLPVQLTPVRSNSSHTQGMNVMLSSSPMSARSVVRVRGFAVHSPRTELVL